MSRQHMVSIHHHHLCPCGCDFVQIMAAASPPSAGSDNDDSKQPGEEDPASHFSFLKEQGEEMRKQQHQERTTCLDSLPWEVWLQVLGFLDSPRDLASLALVCRYCNALVSHPLLWKGLFLSYPWIKQFAEKELDQTKYDATRTSWQAKFKQTFLMECSKRAWLRKPPDIQTHVFEGHTSDVSRVRYSSNVLVSASYDQTIRVWDLETLSCRAKVCVAKQVYDVWFDEGKDLILTGSGDCKIKMWSFNKPNKLLGTLSHHNGSVWSLAAIDYSLFSGSFDSTIIKWDLHKQVPLEIYSKRNNGHSEVIYVVRVAEDIIASGSYDRTVKIWDAKTNKNISTLKGHSSYIYQLQLDDYAIISAGGDNTMKFWDRRMWKEFKKYQVNSPVWAMQGDQTKLVAGLKDSEIVIIDRNTGNIENRLVSHNGAVWGLQFDDDHPLYQLVSCSKDRTICCHDLHPNGRYSREQKQLAAKWKDELSMLREMGFVDTKKNIRILERLESHHQTSDSTTLTLAVDALLRMEQQASKKVK